MRKEAFARNVLPLTLLADGRKCLIVGAGKVALRKTLLLLDAHAVVTIVSPAADSEIHALAAAERITYLPREFTDSDVEDQCLVFAATDDRGVNKHVLQLCRALRIFCAAADDNWVDGDFVTPAMFRKEDLTVAVTTGGRSCRKSRLIRDSLAKHVELAESADLMVIGTSHQLLSIKERQPFHLPGEDMERVGEMLMQIWGVHEFLILNTCNRVELMAVVSKKSSIEGLLTRIMGFDHLDRAGFYVKLGGEAFEHVSLLSAGLLSQSPGESNIVGQIKGALEFATKAGWSGAMLQEWVSSALHVSKDIRQATAAYLRRLEVDEVCVDFLKSLQGDMKLHAMVIGIGKVGNKLVRGILTMNPENTCDWCYHNHRPELDRDHEERVRLHPLSVIPERVGMADVIVSAASSPEPLLRKQDAGSLRNGVVIVDLAVPRNIDPDLDHLPGLKVMNLDGLKQWRSTDSADMERALAAARNVLLDHGEFYEKLVNGFQGGNSNRLRSSVPFP